MSEDIKSESIFVVGFPKSGNTWLTRLLADCLKMRAGSGMNMDDEKEVATTVNIQSNIPDDTQYVIRKTHYLPDVLERNYNGEISKVVYIYRDFRDIVVSSFFYKNQRMDENLVAKSIKAGMLKKIGIWLQKQLWKIKEKEPKELFIRHVVSISKCWSPEVGSWMENINSWKRFAISHKDIDFAFVSYEELLKDPLNSLMRIIDKLKIEAPSHEQIIEAIKRQSFENQKKFFKEFYDKQKKLPLGKKFNYRFIRKGIAGDWKKFFTQEIGRQVNKTHGQFLKEIGYGTDPNWFKKL